MLTPLLAQTSPLSPQAAPPPLPAAPLLPRLVLEQPLPLVFVLVVAAMVAFVSLRRRGKPGLALLVAGDLTVTAVGLFILASVIQTGRERIAAGTLDLVRATKAVDLPALQTMLAPDCRLMPAARDSARGRAEIPGEGWDKAAILDATARYLKTQYPLKEAAVLEVQSVIDGPTSGRTQVRVRAVPDAFQVPVFSWWRLTWRQAAEGDWRVTAIEPLVLPGG